MEKINKEIEYEDAPSGYVTFYNYKEPLMNFDGGYGFKGAVVFDGESDKVQCHFCGDWFVALGNHLHKEHNMLVRDYKEAVGLSPNTALIGEKLRTRLVANGLERRLENLRPGKPHSQDTKNKIRGTLKKNYAEYQNLRNTCPEQLLERLRRLHREVGRPLNSREITFNETLKVVYGSVRRACDLAGVPYNRVGFNNRKSKYTLDYCVSELHRVYLQDGNFPKLRQLPSGFQKFSYKKLKRLALQRESEYKPSPLKRRYTKEQLLNYLRVFKENHGRNPSWSDAKRKLLPSLSNYSYHFGGIKNALASI